MALLRPGRAAVRGCRRRRRRRSGARRSAARTRGRRRSTGTRAFVRAPAACRSRVTWTHSSRVGTTTRACGPVAPGSPGSVMRCRRGTPKPRVLPVPVRAWPMRSWPASAIGRVSSWIANVRADAHVGERVDDALVDAELGEQRCRLLDVGTGYQRLHLLDLVVDDEVGAVLGGDGVTGLRPGRRRGGIVARRIRLRIGLLWVGLLWVDHERLPLRTRRRPRLGLIDLDRTPCEAAG